MSIAAVVLACLVQDQVDNPEYKGWASFKPGSSVTFKVSNSLNPQGGEQKVTLKSVNETEIVLETDMTIGGQVAGKGVERKVPAKVPAAKAPQNPKEGEEEIEAGGKKLKCKTREFEVKGPTGKPATMKIWVHDEVPGLAARMDLSTDSGFKNSMVAASWEKK
ncbi:MAG: hypothetical protein HY293_19080 [Planctomycetes bacterium]|nr:hypothetical protein [Planctomycetota bacterium]